MVIQDAYVVDPDDPTSAAPPEKSKWQRLWPVFACGAGLYSDGYLNGVSVENVSPHVLGALLPNTLTDWLGQVIGTVNTMLSIIYPKDYKNSSASRNVSSIAFAGTVIGQLAFGWIADNYSRKFAMTASAVLLIVFAALCTGSYGGGTPHGIFVMLTVCRFFLGASSPLCVD